jgi:biotin carboxylase
VKRRVLVVTPTGWDEVNLAALPAEVRAEHELVLDPLRDEDVRYDLDVLAHVEGLARAERGRLQGVFSSGDYPGAAMAALVARALGLPGPSPESVLRSAHKLESRRVQRAAVPEVVPRFARFDPADERTFPPDEHFPCFVKPVKGSFSLFARHVAERGALRAFAAAPALAEYRAYYLRPFELLCARHAHLETDVRAFLAEEPLVGQQVTFEGWVQDGTAHALGLVDTSFHPGTKSFARFDLPSLLSADVQARIARTSGAVALALGLDHTLYNVEYFYDAARDRLGLIEVNPRLCGQFADLYAKVDGTSGYAVALDLATGRAPRVRRGSGSYRAAASVPLRVFRSVRVTRVPGEAERRALVERFPEALFWCECRAGDRLAVGPDHEDGASVRYGVLNLGGADRSNIEAKRLEAERILGFAFEPA